MAISGWSLTPQAIILNRIMGYLNHDNYKTFTIRHSRQTVTIEYNFTGTTPTPPKNFFTDFVQPFAKTEKITRKSILLNRGWRAKIVFDTTQIPLDKLKSSERQLIRTMDLAAACDHPLSEEELNDRMICHHWMHNNIKYQLALALDQSASFSVAQYRALQDFICIHSQSAPWLLSVSIIQDFITKYLRASKLLTDLLCSILIPVNLFTPSTESVSTGSPVYATKKYRKDKAGITPEEASAILTSSKKNWLLLEGDRPGVIIVIHRTNPLSNQAYWQSYFVFIPPNTVFLEHPAESKGTFHLARDRSEAAKMCLVLKTYREKFPKSDIDQMILDVSHDLFLKIRWELNQLKDYKGTAYCKQIPYTLDTQLLPPLEKKTKVVAYQHYNHQSYWRPKTVGVAVSTARTPQLAPPSSPVLLSLPDRPSREHPLGIPMARTSMLFHFPSKYPEKEDDAAKKSQIKPTPT